MPSLPENYSAPEQEETAPDTDVHYRLRSCAKLSGWMGCSSGKNCYFCLPKHGFNREGKG